MWDGVAQADRRNSIFKTEESLMVKNLPASAGDMGLIPSPGKPKCCKATLSPYAITTESCAWALCFPAREAALMRRQHITTRKSPCSNEDPVQPKNN